MNPQALELRRADILGPESNICIKKIDTINSRDRMRKFRLFFSHDPNLCESDPERTKRLSTAHKTIQGERIAFNRKGVVTAPGYSTSSMINFFALLSFLKNSCYTAPVVARGHSQKGTASLDVDLQNRIFRKYGLTFFKKNFGFIKISGFV